MIFETIHMNSFCQLHLQVIERTGTDYLSSVKRDKNLGLAKNKDFVR